MVNETKKQLVKKLSQDIDNSPLVGILNLENLPAQQLQKMRSMLRNNEVLISMARKKLLMLALSGAKKENVQKLTEKIKGMPALIFAKNNPFALYKIIQKNKSPAPAKAGQTAPKDVVVKAGPTNFVPGPIISELATVGIKTKVDGGKLTIIDDTVVVKEGEEINSKVAEMLKRLDIQPMEVGLDLVAVWEDGTIFDAKQLYIDEAEYLQNFAQAAQWAMNLAVESAYLTAETAELLLQKAFQDAKSLALEENILTDLTTKDVLAKVERQASALQGEINLPQAEKKVEEKPAEEPKPEEKEEKKPEAVKEEPKAEDKPVEEPKEKPKEELAEEEAPEPTHEPEPTPEPTKEDVPSAESLIKETKEKFVEPNQEPTEQEQPTEPVSAENLVDEELKVAKEEKKEEEKNKDTSVEDAENLFEKLKKQGTLREEE